jgi:hypothetical protein
MGARSRRTAVVTSKVASALSAEIISTYAADCRHAKKTGASSLCLASGAVNSRYGRGSYCRTELDRWQFRKVLVWYN